LFFKLLNKKKMKYKFLLPAVLGISMMLGSCKLFEVEDIPDLNNPTVESVLTDATAVQIKQLATGVQSAMRGGYYDLSWCGGSIGRECIVFNKTDNRYYTELQGQVNIDPAGIFYPWYNSLNASRRRAEILLRSANNSTALTGEEKKAVEGFAKTVQAYLMLNCLNMMGETGIRTEFNDLLAPGDLLDPGEFKSYTEGLAYCKKLVDDGAAALDGGGATFPFTLASGWAGFNTPATFKKFNRAMAARVAMYQQDWAGMVTALSASYLDPAGSLTTGPVFNYSTGTGDATNPFFQPLDETNRPIAVQNGFLADAEAGDDRVFGTSIREGGKAKIRQRTATVTLGGYPESTHELQAYVSNVSNVSIIRNEELILMWAEAKIQGNQLADGVAALDIVRTAHGLAALATAKPTILNNKDALIDEVLNQRRYSLYMEGSHRWFDMRRYNKLGSLPLDLPTHQVWTAYPKPQSEVDWDGQ
jgi:starch-binding outer membrane protein, SusD/RagB family